jgi:hypothetical protein
MHHTTIEDVTLIRSTTKAGLYEIDGEQYWLPWSAIADGSVDRDGETGELYLATWLAEREGFE